MRITATKIPVSLRALTMSPCPCLNGGLLALAPLVPWAKVLIKEGQLRLDPMEINLRLKTWKSDQKAETETKIKGQT